VNASWAAMITGDRMAYRIDSGVMRIAVKGFWRSVRKNRSVVPI